MSRTPSVYSDAPEMLDELMEETSDVSTNTTSSTRLCSQRQSQRQQLLPYHQDFARPAAMLQLDPDADPIEQDSLLDDEPRESDNDDDDDDDDDAEQNVDEGSDEIIAEVGALAMSTAGESSAVHAGQMEIDEQPDRLSLSGDMEMQIDHGPLSTTGSSALSSTRSMLQASTVSPERHAVEGRTRVGFPSSASSSNVSFSQSSTAIPATVVSTGRTVSVPVVDEKAQAELRRKIMEIQRDPKISFSEKAGLIQVDNQPFWEARRSPVLKMLLTT